MRLRIRHKIFLTLLATAAGVAVCMTAVIRWTFDRGFLNYVNQVELARVDVLSRSLGEMWAKERSWRFLADDPGRWDELLRASWPERFGRRPPSEGPEKGEGAEEPARVDRPRPAPPKIGPPFRRRVVLLDVEKRRVAGEGPVTPALVLRPLSVGGATAGYLGLEPPAILSDAHEVRFAAEQRNALLLSCLAITAVAALLSAPLARQMGRGIAVLAEGTHRLASGRYDSRVPEGGTDELGSLSRDFNHLARTLEANEAGRRRWVADISHELRTPLSVLRGEIEAIQDGVRPLDEAALSTLHGETLRLGRIVDDLYELSLSDIGALAYRMERTDLAGIVREAVDSFRGDFKIAGIAVTVSPSLGAPCTLEGDASRLHQLFANLLSNSLRYTDPGGRIEVSVDRDGRSVRLLFDDSAPGVPDGSHERLFERLYRVDGSRNRQTGGAGLGLSICRNIAEGHGGTIAASPSPLGGLRVTVTLPLPT